MASYAYGGDGGPGLIGNEFGRPTPLHVLRAREAERALLALPSSIERRVDAQVAEFGRVTQIVAEVWHGEVVTAGAKRLQALADEAGFTTHIIERPEMCVVEGLLRLADTWCGFRARWVRGSADGGSWHAPWKYEMITDTRPFGLDETARIAKVGHRDPRTAHYGDQRINLTACPGGMPMNVTEITRRVREVGSAS
jgi:hypothetical protein